LEYTDLRGCLHEFSFKDEVKYFFNVTSSEYPKISFINLRSVTTLHMTLLAKHVTLRDKYVLIEHNCSKGRWT